MIKDMVTINKKYGSLELIRTKIKHKKLITQYIKLNIGM